MLTSCVQETLGSRARSPAWREGHSVYRIAWSWSEAFMIQVSHLLLHLIAKACTILIISHSAQNSSKAQVLSSTVVKIML